MNTSIITAGAVGFGAGVASIYMLNSELVNTAAEKVGSGIKASYDAMTYKNVKEFTFTIIGLNWAAAVIFPNIHSIFQYAIGGK